MANKVGIFVGRYHCARGLYFPKAHLKIISTLNVIIPFTICLWFFSLFIFIYFFEFRFNIFFIYNDFYFFHCSWFTAPTCVKTLHFQTNSFLFLHNLDIITIISINESTTCDNHFRQVTEESQNESSNSYLGLEICLVSPGTMSLANA